MKRILFILLLIPCFASAQITVGWTIGDNASAIQSALNNAGYGGTVRLDGVHTYTSSTQIKVPNGVTFDGQGSTIKPTSGLPYTGSYFITTPSATLHSATGLSIPIVEGSTTFTYGNASKLTSGNILVVKGPAYYANPVDNVNYLYGYLNTSSSISGTTVAINNPFPASFTATSIYEYKTGTNIHIKNLVVDMTGRTADNALQLNYTTNSSVEYVTVIGTLPAPANGMAVGINVQGVNNTIYRCKSYGMDATSIGYGFSAMGDNNVISHCLGYANRHTFASASRDYISTRIVYEYDTVLNQSTGASTEQMMDMHGNCWHSRIQNCYVQIGGMANTGIQLRGRYDTAQYNTVVMANTGSQYLYAFLFHENPYYSIARFNTIQTNGLGNNKYVGSGNIYGTPVGAQFTDNVVGTAKSSAPGWLLLANNTTDGDIVIPPDTTSVVTNPPPPTVDTCDCWIKVPFK